MQQDRIVQMGPQYLFMTGFKRTMNTNSRMNLWTLLTIDDPACLPGKSIQKVIQHVLKVIKFKFVVIDDINGAGISLLVKNENSIMPIEKLLEELPNVKQFDWGDFFLFKENPGQWQDLKNESYSHVISQSDTTIRAIDDQYIYIYTPYEEVVAAVQKSYKIESIKKDFLENLDCPY